MKAETETTEIDFENFVNLFYKIYHSFRGVTENEFMEVLSRLERSLQDLDITGNEKLVVRETIVRKLKYWELILNETIPTYARREPEKNLLVNALVYNLNYLAQCAIRAFRVVDLSKFNSQISNILPAPDDHFVIKAGVIKQYRPDFSLILLKQFLENYITNKFANTIEPISNDNIESFKKFEKLIERGSDYQEVMNKYVKGTIKNLPDTIAIPIYVFLDTDNEAAILNYYNALKKLTQSLDLEIVFEYKPEKGSWVRRIISKTKKIATSDEVVERLKKIEHGIELNTINKTQSEIDKNQAKALAALLNASSNIPRLATLIGSLLLVKTTNENGEAVVIARTLTTEDIITLKMNPTLLHDPSKILMALENIRELHESRELRRKELLLLGSSEETKK